MSLLACAAIALSLTPGPEAGATMTFDEAMSLAAARTSSASPLRLDASNLWRARLPNVRAEVAGNTSRTLDLFSEGPLEVRYASSVIAFDYPLWDGGATNARIRAVQDKLRRVASRSSMDDAHFNELLNAFGDLYLAQRQSEVLRPLYDRLTEQENRIAMLLSSGQISNLTAADRREIALGFASRLLEIEARRIDALAKLRLLTGIDSEPRLVIDLKDESLPSSDSFSDDSVRATNVAVEDARARLREVQSATRLRATLSGFAGVGAAQSEFRHIASDGSFGVYGLRVLVSYPLFRGSNALAEAEARADVEETLSMQRAAVEAAQLRMQEYRYQEQTAAKRIALLEQSVEVAREREGSVQRLVQAGFRQEGDLAQVEAERIRREADLIAAEIERWKASQLLARMSAGGETRAAE